jgi:hypothetical protein
MRLIAFEAPAASQDVKWLFCGHDGLENVAQVL